MPTANVSFVALYLFEYTVNKPLRRILGIKYNDKTVLGNVLSKEGTIIYGRRFSFLYGHFC
jgi:hypothetical protein